MTSSKPWFQSTHPVWGATWMQLGERQIYTKFQSTHPVWGATRGYQSSVALVVVSIHAPRVGCDTISQKRCFWTKVSIHAPRVGCDLDPEYIARQKEEFQSTHPVWGATCVVGSPKNVSLFQSTHPVWGATLSPIIAAHEFSVSIHAPRVGCDEYIPSLWLFPAIVSIHAPRVGCDRIALNIDTLPESFNPRTPCGVRHVSMFLSIVASLFQSTHPVWGATSKMGSAHGHKAVSIHAPRVGCDMTLSPCRDHQSCFNPRTPCGVRPADDTFLRQYLLVSIHAPRVGCDIKNL